MTDYELLDLLISHMELVHVYFLSFISATSAFLVVAHSAAKKLSSAIVKIAVTLYLFTTIFFIANFQRSFTITINVRDQISNAQLSWYATVYEPQWIMPSTMWIGVFIMLILSVASTWYFISSR